MTASEPIRFSFSKKEKLKKRKTAQGTAPRPAHAPRDPPGERASRERYPTEMGYTAEKVSAFGAKAVRSASRAARPDLAFPSRGRCRRSRRMRCSAAARLCRQMLHFASLTEILSLRYRLSVFLSRRKKNSEKERPLRGLRREVRFIMSPPGKRRHNELNAAPPPETPRGTGKTGETNNRDVVQSGESFCIRAKPVCSASRAARPQPWLPLEGCEAGAW